MLVQKGRLLVIYKEDILHGTFNEWDEVVSIEPRCFYDVKQLLHYINIPDHVVYLGEEVFRNCEILEEAHIGYNCTNIGDAAFKYCVKLSNVKLPKKLTYIPKGMFFQCSSLNKINLPSNIEIIEKEAFFNCNLKKIIFPENLKRIGDKAFQNNFNLKKVTFSKSLVEVGKNAFSNCIQLENIEFNNIIEKIPESCFFGCDKLSTVTFPANIKNIEKQAFCNCVILNEIKFDNNDIEIESQAFNGCSKIKKVIVNNNVYYPIQYNGYLSMKRFQMTASIKLILNVKFDDIKKTNIIYPASFVELLDKNAIKRLYNKDIIKHFKNVYNNYRISLLEYNNSNVRAFYKFAYYIGCFSDKTYYKDGKEVSVAQQASVFLKYILDNNIIKFENFYNYFNDLEINEACIDMIKFLNARNKINGELIYENFNYLLNKKKSISEIFNMIDEIKKIVITDKKGRIIKDATIKRKIEAFLSFKRFKNVKEEDIDLANELAQFPTIRQENYDEAVEIKKLATNTPSHILLQELKEEVIKERIKKIKSDTSISIEKANYMIKKLDDLEFTYEWLDKHDPKNFTLGLYCECCASIVSTIYGKDIMMSSITRDDMQNLKIVDKEGNTVAKATMYINKDKGYIVFNTIQTSCDQDDLEKMTKIYKAFKRAINDFVKKYDCLYSEKPIKIINIGMGGNDLSDLLIAKSEESKELYDVPSFFVESSLEQRTLYTRPKK